VSGTQYIRPLVIRHVENELPTGLIDGLNSSYSTEFKFQAGTLKVYLNGLRLVSGIGNDYTITDNQNFVMNYTPLTGDMLLVDYLRQ